MKAHTEKEMSQSGFPGKGNVASDKSSSLRSDDYQNLQPSEPLSTLQLSVNDSDQVSRLHQLSIAANRSHRTQQMTQLLSYSDNADHQVTEKDFDEIVQKRSVDPGGTTKSVATAQVWLDENVRHATGDLYTKNVGHENTKEELIQTIALEAGNIGSGLSTNKRHWAQTVDAYGGDKLDAFRVRISGTFDLVNTPLAMDYHFGPRSHGYVVNVSEGAHTSAMVDNNPHHHGTGVAATFSSTHRQTEDENLLANTAHAHGVGTSQRDSEKAWDSHTKIAGEGARFVSVRNHAGNLRDNSKFFTRNKNAFKWIQFKELWLTWSATFNKAFNIPDHSIANRLNNNTMQKLVGADDVQDAVTVDGNAGGITVNADYNLDKEASATLADTKTWKTIDFAYRTAGKGRQGRMDGNGVTTALDGAPGVIRKSVVREIRNDDNYSNYYQVLVENDVTPQDLNDLLADLHRGRDTITVEGLRQEDVESDSEAEEVEEDLIAEEEEERPTHKTKDLSGLGGFYTRETNGLLRSENVSQREIEAAIRKGGTGFQYSAEEDTVTYAATDKFNEIIRIIVRSVAKEKSKKAPEKTLEKATKKAVDKKRSWIPESNLGKGMSLAFLVVIVLLVIQYLPQFLSAFT